METLVITYTLAIRLKRNVEYSECFADAVSMLSWVTRGDIALDCVDEVKLGGHNVVVKRNAVFFVVDGSQAIFLIFYFFFSTIINAFGSRVGLKHE